MDDYYITGALARGVNASYESINSLYIVNTNLVEQRFLGKKSEYTVFGHLPGSLNKIYSIWSYILTNQVTRYPGLLNIRARIVYESDFLYLQTFGWSFDLWREFFKPPLQPSKSLNLGFEVESF